MEHSRLVHVLCLVFDCEAFYISVVLVGQPMLKEEVCNFKLFVDDGNHVGREVIHGALNIDIFSIL